ncbi:HPF/RaiA family ribosome-associated protein [Microbulbifer pacificus]|uniref:HPF/RaiA family ribosome-associated protein n=1 Tax=Microbulbifer pacificus TaxID=407164 RepID=A0AAU0N1Z4_9GAMM|nr:HPF/RaiA family ribosome-associated protein [Microbulbifer pacificus]WOX06350.1 HPF/RaiA family ribosome-associated protein [Microbulbifer pacificus]
MKIQVNTDRTIEGNESLEEHTREILERILKHFTEKITRMEVHLGEKRSADHGDIMETHCMLEVRVAGMQPVAVNDSATTLDQAVTGAARKMESMLESEFGRLGR